MCRLSTPAPTPAPDVSAKAPAAKVNNRVGIPKLLDSKVLPGIVLSVLPPPKRCQYPIGEPGRASFRFCDDVTVPGKAYCAEHCKNCFVRLVNREESRSHAE
jgi:GcrA cell cycle regulator